MIRANYYAIRPLIQKTIFIKRCRVEIMALFFVLFHWDDFLNFCCLFRQRFSAAYLLKKVRLPHVFILPSLAGVTNLCSLVGVCAAYMLAYKCDKMKWCVTVTVVAILSQKALLMCSYVSSGKFSAWQCVHRIVLAPFAAYIWSLFNFCKPFGYRNDPCYCRHISPFMSSGGVQVVQIFL